MRPIQYEHAKCGSPEHLHNRPTSDDESGAPYVISSN